MEIVDFPKFCVSKAIILFSLQTYGYVIPKINVVIYSSKDFDIKSLQEVKVDSKVAMSIIRKIVCIFYNNCKIKSRYLLL